MKKIEGTPTGMMDRPKQVRARRSTVQRAAGSHALCFVPRLLIIAFTQTNTNTLVPWVQPVIIADCGEL